MSEWIHCPKCGTTHENQTACPEPSIQQPTEEQVQAVNDEFKKTISKNIVFDEPEQLRTRIAELEKTMRIVAEWLERSDQIELSQQISRSKDLARELRHTLNPYQHGTL